jgi:hypothetical protein
MVRTLACAVLVLAMTFALATASELKGNITRVNGNSISFTTTATADEKAQAKTLTADKEVMVYRLVKKKRVEVSEGLKATDFQNIAKGGVAATVIINDDTKKVTEITLGGGKKK